MFQDLIQITVLSFQDLWLAAIPVIIKIVGALILLILGLIVASGVAAVVERVVKVLKLDDLLRKLGVEEHFGRAGLKLNSAKFFGALTYWFAVAVVVMSLVGWLGFAELSGFLREVALYIPNILVAALILLAAIVVAHFLKGVVVASVKSAKLHSPSFLGALTWWAVVVFGFFAALLQLEVAVSIINSLVTGFIAMLALAGGIAFGLGGKDVASGILKKLEGHVKD